MFVYEKIKMMIEIVNASEKILGNKPLIRPCILPIAKPPNAATGINIKPRSMLGEYWPIFGK